MRAKQIQNKSIIHVDHKLNTLCINMLTTCNTSTMGTFSAKQTSSPQTATTFLEMYDEDFRGNEYSDENSTSDIYVDRIDIDDSICIIKDANELALKSSLVIPCRCDGSGVFERAVEIGPRYFDKVATSLVSHSLIISFFHSHILLLFHSPIFLLFRYYTSIEQVCYSFNKSSIPEIVTLFKNFSGHKFLNVFDSSNKLRNAFCSIYKYAYLSPIELELAGFQKVIFYILTLIILNHLLT